MKWVLSTATSSVAASVTRIGALLNVAGTSSLVAGGVMSVEGVGVAVAVAVAVGVAVTCGATVGAGVANTVVTGPGTFTIVGGVGSTVILLSAFLQRTCESPRKRRTQTTR